MMAEERRERIAAALTQRGFMSIGDITAHVGCSVATARRDLDTLARLGRARRARGGALSSGDAGAAGLAPVARDLRRDTAADPFATVKRRIAHAAAELVMDRDTVGLTGGTTTLAVARKPPSCAPSPRARRTIIVADHRKIGWTAVTQVLPLAAVAALVTDAGPSPAREAIEGAGVRVIAV